MSEAAETSARAPRGGVGVTLLLIAFAAVAIGAQAFWVAVLIWLVIRAVF